MNTDLEKLPRWLPHHLRASIVGSRLPWRLAEGAPEAVVMPCPNCGFDAQLRPVVESDEPGPPALPAGRMFAMSAGELRSHLRSRTYALGYRAICTNGCEHPDVLEALHVLGERADARAAEARRLSARPSAPPTQPESGPHSAAPRETTKPKPTKGEQLCLG